MTFIQQLREIDNSIRIKSKSETEIRLLIQIVGIDFIYNFDNEYADISCGDEDCDQIIIWEDNINDDIRRYINYTHPSMKALYDKVELIDSAEDEEEKMKMVNQLPPSYIDLCHQIPIEEFSSLMYQITSVCSKHYGSIKGCEDLVEETNAKLYKIDKNLKILKFINFNFGHINVSLSKTVKDPINAFDIYTFGYGSYSRFYIYQRFGKIYPPIDTDIEFEEFIELYDFSKEKEFTKEYFLQIKKIVDDFVEQINKRSLVTTLYRLHDSIQLVKFNSPDNIIITLEIGEFRFVRILDDIQSMLISKNREVIIWNSTTDGNIEKYKNFKIKDPDPFLNEEVRKLLVDITLLCNKFYLGHYRELFPRIVNASVGKLVNNLKTLDRSLSYESFRDINLGDNDHIYCTLIHKYIVDPDVKYKEYYFEIDEKLNLLRFSIDNKLIFQTNKTRKVPDTCNDNLFLQKILDSINDIRDEERSKIM